MKTTQRKKRLRHDDLFNEIQYQFYLDMGRISLIRPPSPFQRISNIAVSLFPE